MVLAAQCDGEHREPLNDVKLHVYHLGGDDASGGFSCINSHSHGMLDLLLLSQWEDSAWKGRFRYDVTACETKVICGKSKFVVQLNKKYDSYSVKNFERKFLRPSGAVGSRSYMKDHRGEILLCISPGDEKPGLVTSETVPTDGVLVIANESPIEYGNMFLLPYQNKQAAALFWDKKVFGLVTRIAAEVNSSSFYVSFDYNPGTSPDHTYFQTMYYARLFPVEHFPTRNIYGDSHETGVVISEVVGYPLKCLILTSQQLELLVDAVTEIFSALHKLSSSFSLLISEHSSKIFLFPQVQRMGESSMSAWECGGHFVYNAKLNYDHVSEAEVTKRMVSFSLNDKDFEALKHICCTVAVSLTF